MEVESSLSIQVSPVSPGSARKRRRQPEKWKSNLRKKLLYSPKSLPEFPICGHMTKTYRCSTLTMKEILTFYEDFYKHTAKIDQDNFILRFLKCETIQRRRPKNSKYNKRIFSTKYLIRVKRGEEIKYMHLCKNAFLGILQITKGRLDRLIKNFATSNLNATERRGGDRKTIRFGEKKKEVMNFLSTLQCVESHYCRATTRRKYLDSSLSINKLWKLYNQQTTVFTQVKKSYFRSIFVHNFNLGFGGPRTDVCSTCLELQEKIKNEKDTEKKKNLLTEKYFHKARSKAFYNKLRDPNPELLILSFDVQKNQCLPKLPDQQAYYSRQLYFHNFTVVQGTSKTNLSPKTVSSYCFTEDVYGKGSSQIASFLWHHLNNLNVTNYKNIRLVCDGCSGQNKNKTILAMCCKWLASIAPKNIESIEIVYPVRGHSFLPADRVFGLIEKDIKKLEVIVKPEEYESIISKYSTIVKPGKDCNVYDWKTEAEKWFKPIAKWHFKFLQSKRFLLMRNRDQSNVLVQGEQSYNSNISRAMTITKKHATAKNIDPDLINPNNIHNIRRIKLQDVEKLLIGHYGEEWKKNEKLTYFKNVLQYSSYPTVINMEEQLCEAHEEDVLSSRI